MQACWILETISVGFEFEMLNCTLYIPSGETSVQKQNVIQPGS